MDNLVSATEISNHLRVGAFAAWLVTVLLAVAGIQRIKEIIAFVLMKLYEFFIQQYSVKL